MKEYTGVEYAGVGQFSFPQHNQSYPTLVPNFKILVVVVPEKC